jgi:hypothetical protein
VLRHQLNVLRRGAPKRVAVRNIDHLVFAGLYRLAPEVLDAVKILKPETVIRWHRRRLPCLVASVCNAARDRNSLVTAYQINLRRSPIAVIINRFAGDRQPFWVYGGTRQNCLVQPTTGSGTRAAHSPGMSSISSGTV